MVKASSKGVDFFNQHLLDNSNVGRLFETASQDSNKGQSIQTASTWSNIFDKKLKVVRMFGKHLNPFTI